MPVFIAAGHDKEFDLHLFEFPDTEDEILGCDFIAISLPDLRDPEWKLPVRGIEDILKVDENALRRFGPKISLVLVVLDRTDGGLEHQIEWARLSQVV